MAKVTPGLGGTQLAGRIGGLVFRPSPTGSVLRANQQRRTVRSTRFDQQHRLFRASVSRWRQLTDAQRLEWNRQAPNGKTGLQYFMSCWIPVFRMFSTEIVRPPIPFSRPQPIVFVVTASLTPFVLSVGCTNPFVGSARWGLYATAPYRPSVRNHSGRSFHFLTTYTAFAPSDKSSNYANLWYPLDQRIGNSHIMLRAQVVTSSGLVAWTSEIEVSFTP